MIQTFSVVTNYFTPPSHEPASAPVSAPPRPLAVNFAGIGLKNTGKKSLTETLETLKVGPGYATCQFVVSGGVFNVFAGILWAHARPFSLPLDCN